MNEKKILSINEMKDRLELYGHKEIWQTIEKIGNWQERIAYRQLFFMVGGQLE